MMRLVKRGLMFGNLVAVNTPALVARYNRALKHLIGAETNLPEFHVDISGYSPEIGDELGDNLYLNPNGCNRQFILLSTDQKTAPLLNAQFSTSRSILRHFIEENEEQLFALTAREAVAGELQNSVYTVNHPADLLKIREIEITADTVQSHIEDSNNLLGMIDTFTHQPDAWWDDILIAEMIETAKKTGDVTRNPITLQQGNFTQGNFHTLHFNGLYVFRDVDFPAVIAKKTGRSIEEMPIGSVMSLRDRNEIANFLELNNLAEPIVNAQGMDVAAVLAQKMDFIVIDGLSSQEADLSRVSRQNIRKMLHTSQSKLPPEYHALADLHRWARTGRDWPRITSEHPAYFYTLRASDTADKDLVNMLLAELTPRDFRQLFICHKHAFYAAYAQWPEAKKDYVARFLATEYAMDKAGVRDELFGHEPAMEEEPVDIITRVGPWGAVRGGT